MYTSTHILLKSSLFHFQLTLNKYLKNNRRKDEMSWVKFPAEKKNRLKSVCRTNVHPSKGASLLAKNSTLCLFSKQNGTSFYFTPRDLTIIVWKFRTVTQTDQNYNFYCICSRELIVKFILHKVRKIFTF